VRAAMPTDTALVSIVRFNRTMLDPPTVTSVPSYVAFVLRPGTDDPAVVPLGRPDALEALIAQWPAYRDHEPLVRGRSPHTDVDARAV
jgi:hypothetical protein